MNSITKVPLESRWSVFYLLAALAVLAALVAAPQAHATSGYNSTWQSLYPGSASDSNAGCQLCHGNSTQNINPYGFAMAQCNGASGSITQRIQAIEGQDSDGQGDSNITEINANTQPGWTTGAMQVWTRNGCAPAGSNTYQDAGDVDPVAGNAPPTADANGPYSGTAGQQVSFDGSGSADSDGAITAYNWTFGDGGTGTGVSPTHTYAAAGTYNVSLVVTDNAGDSSAPSTSTATIVSAPQDPIANPNGPYTGFEGQAVAFDGSGSSDPDGGNITAYDWDFGDGNTGTGVAPSHTYTTAGTYTVTLTVVDDEGAQSAPATTTATIDVPPSNLPPVSDPNGPYTGATDQPVSFDGSGSSDPDGTVASYAWNFGDGNTGTGVSPTHTYAAAGTYTVSLTVTDNQGAASSPATTTATISDDAPPSDCVSTLTITRAEWDDDRVEIRGNGTDGCGPVTATNAFNPSQVLGVDTSPSRIRINSNENPNPVPCVVRVEQDGVTTQRDVANAPSDCGPKAPANDAPIANANGPYTGAVGDPVQFSSDGSIDPNGTIQSYSWDFGDGNSSSEANPSHAYEDAGEFNVTLTVTDNDGAIGTDVTTANIDSAAASGDPIARGDTYATAVGKELTVQLSRVSGVLYNDFDTDTSGKNIGNDGLTAVLIEGPSKALDFDFNVNGDGSFTYTPDATLTDNSNDSFTYQAMDADGNLSEVATVNIHVLSDQPDFKIMMNYELGMHCTGFEFSYCCVLPPYNSILTQVVKPQPQQGEVRSNADFARLLEGDPNNGLDGLGRETVVRDYDDDGNFSKYYLEYFHDAQPRREGQGKPQVDENGIPTSTLISDIEGNSMLYHNTPFDSAQVDGNGTLVRGNYAGISNVVLGDGDYTAATDNYANGWLNHFYIYTNEEGHPNLEGENATAGRSLDADKIRLGVSGHVEYPANSGAALQPMGPTGNGAFDNVLTFSGDTGTVVYTQSKVLENLPIMLTSPRIWEALGLPLTPFEDSINFFAEPGSVDEDSIRPYVAMKARLHHASCDSDGNCSKGGAVIGSNNQPVIGHGTAPIDIPNCERCHSVPAYQADGETPNVNSPSYVRRQDGPNPFSGPNGETLEAMTDLEIEYWKSIYPSLNTGSDWYARLKGAAINMMVMHDYDTGTSFTANYPATGNPLGLPPEKAAILQNTRLGFESVICQKCHGDNVIAAVNPLGPDAGFFLPPISEAIHNTHKNQSEGGVIVFNDGLGRDGGCQGCHPAHRSDGVMDNYPITIAGDNANASGDNRLNQGGCFVGRDVHSNPLKDVDGAETPEHLNAVGKWLVANVARGQADELGGTEDNRGIWCTNCHSQLGQEIWRTEDCDDLIHGDCLVNPRAEPTLKAVAEAVGLTEDEAIDYLDPKVNGFDRGTDQTHAVWNPAIDDADAVTIELGPNGPVGTTDADGDFSVNILSFCTTQDCVDGIKANKGDESQWRYPEGGAVDGTAGFIDQNNTALAVPFSAATDGRDHWLAGGEPHCADCHEAPYVEQSGNINPFPPFNYPAKAGLMRYSRGHQDLSCQGCHESIHGLYPVSAAIDTTSYAQAAALNADGSHGPLKCGACHQVNGQGIPDWHEDNNDGDFRFGTTFDEAVTFAHTFTAEADPLDSLCQNCHEDERGDVRADKDDWLEHAMKGRTSRLMMDKAEISRHGHVLGAEPGRERRDLCSECHDDEENGLGDVECDSEWREHLSQGRVSESVWEEVSLDETGTRCGW